MKKMIFALLLSVFSLFTVTSAQAAPAKTDNQASVTQAKKSGHWEYWCVYNEKTGEFEIIAVWVEDDMYM